MVYPVSGGELDSSPSFPDLEQKTLAFWKQDDTFKASIARRADADEFVFYDGPPFANGLPHYGHLLTGYVKDVVPRFQTMKGKKVERRFGWDTHGLPAELEAMRELGMTEKSEIEEMGLQAFNNAARASVLKYTEEWQDYVTRQARWVDFDNDYKTLDPTYMESVIWAFKTLYDKGRAYEGYYVLPYCWKDQTPLSNHELRMDDDVYQDRQDQTVTVTFPFTGDKARELGLEGVRALAWTTTPWTLPTNFSLAVGPDLTYVTVPAGPNGAGDGAAAGEARYLMVKDLIGSYAKDLGYDGPDDVLAALDAREYAGSELEYVEYEPLWTVYSEDREKWGTQNAFIVTVADYVSTDDGTGVVHQATAYGEIDQQVNAAYGIPVILSVDDGAKFLDYFRGTALDEIAGLQVFDANKPIIQILRRDGRLMREMSHVHSYPHCWRCRNPLIYKAVGSWYIKVADQRDEMQKLNDQITWIPENVKYGQFGKWLEGARDWAVSRNRYFGSPIPVWKSDDPNHPRTEVYGSLAELEEAFGRLPRDEHGEVNLHRPYIDDLTRPNPDDPTGQSTMRRITDVLDVWFDSGSMPFAQVHYPFENTDWFDTHNPADFIVEYIGQTRGWFYVMHVLATALFDRPAFSNVISHGIVLGDDGLKMSKSLRNYPDVNEVFDRDGADAMRWFLMSSPILRGGNLIVTAKGIRDTVRKVLIPLWNAYYFFGLYANAYQGGKGYAAKPISADNPATDVLDRYLLAKTHELVETVDRDLTDYGIAQACEDVLSYLDMLTNWYIRRSRDRFWGNDERAFDTLYTALEALCRTAAPLLPLTLEEIWKGLTGGRSVHLTDYPEAGAYPADPALVAAMDRVREVASAGNGLRKTRQLRARLPLASLTVVSDGVAALEPFRDLLGDELNIKQIRLVDGSDPEAADLGVVQKLTVNARAAGPRLGKSVQAAIKGSKTGEWSVGEDGTVTSGGIELADGEFSLDMVADTSAGGKDAHAVQMLPRNGFVVLDTEVTAKLAAEGTARDIIRAVQQARRDADFEITDRIVLEIVGDDEAIAAATAHRELIEGETLAARSVLRPRSEAGEGARPAGTLVSEAKVGDGLAVAIGVARA